MSKIKEKLVRGAHQLVFKTKKNSPLLLTIGGIVGFGVTAYGVYKARPKVEEIVQEVENARELGEPIDKVAVAKDVVVALAIPITTGVLSTTAIVWSYKIQMNRIGVLAASLASTQAAKSAFEHRVKEKLGEAAYNELIATKERKVVTPGEEGEEDIEEIITEIQDFDSNICEWYKNSEEYFSDDHAYNMHFIDSAEKSLELMLFRTGELTLNDVRKKLGFTPTKYQKRNGALLGWTADDYFAIEKIVVNEEVNGEKVPQILVRWSTPRYIYDSVD